MTPEEVKVMMVKSSIINTHPELIGEIHPTRNGEFDPRNYSHGSHKKIWWKCPKGDDHEWQASIYSRVNGNGCSVCAGKTVVKSNSLEHSFPEIAKQWHPTKNGELIPEKVYPGSHKRVWWKCPVDEDHVWQSTIYNRTRGTNCPFCSGQMVAKSNCLSTTHPELAREWHPTKNGKLTPESVTAGSSHRVWWKCPKGDDHEWQAVIYSRKNGNGCSVCSGRTVVRSNSLAHNFPEISKEWHPTKNGKITPADVYHGSQKRVWWKCFEGQDHEWETPIFQRTNIGVGCPVCAGRMVVKSNCLSTTNPEIALQWYQLKNDPVTPEQVTAGSDKKFWWKCENGDDHLWKTSVNIRTRGSGCPICSNNKLVESNSLEALFPELASEWHLTKNGTLTPADVQAYSNRQVWWQCKVNPNHAWKAYINNRHKAGCPYCGGLGGSKYEIRIYSELLTVFPDTEFHAKIHGKEIDVYISSLSLGIEYDGKHWHQNKEKKDTAKNEFLNSKGVKVIRIRESGLNLTSINDINFDPKSSDLELTLSLMEKIKSVIPTGNPAQDRLSSYLMKSKLQNNDYTEFLVNWFPKPVPGQSLQDKYPAIASEWHPSRNSFLKPKDVSPHAGFKVWWQCEKGHEWETTIDHRTSKSKTGCPECYRLTPRNVKIPERNILAVAAPSIALEWHPIRNAKLTPQHVGYKSHKKVWWKCPNNHEWEARIDSRTAGNGCPYCSGRLKS